MNTAVLLFTQDDDVHVFASVPMAARWMEAVDVEEGEYVVAYLPDGRRFVPVTEAGLVRLVPAGDVDEDDLRRRLAAYRERVPTSPATGDAATFAVETLGWHASRRWTARIRRLLQRSR